MQDDAPAATISGSSTNALIVNELLAGSQPLYRSITAFLADFDGHHRNGSKLAEAANTEGRTRIHTKASFSVRRKKAVQGRRTFGAVA